jgi:hypothetical protein
MISHYRTAVALEQRFKEGSTVSVRAKPFFSRA